MGFHGPDFPDPMKLIVAAFLFGAVVASVIVWVFVV